METTASTVKVSYSLRQSQIQELRDLAEAQGRPFYSLIREALTESVRRLHPQAVATAAKRLRMFAGVSAPGRLDRVPGAAKRGRMKQDPHGYPVQRVTGVSMPPIEWMAIRMVAAESEFCASSVAQGLIADYLSRPACTGAASCPHCGESLQQPA